MTNFQLYSYFGARYYMSDVSVWLSVDPMREKYPYQSPYTYCGWSPIKIMDPNGTSEIVVLTGDENAKQETKNQMNRGFSEGFKVDYDNNGKMNYQGTAQTKEEKDLVTAIDDPNRQVSLKCTYDNFVSEPYSDITVELTVGAYFGNSQYEDFTSAFQVYNPEQANIFATNGGCPASVSSVHEILEAYTGMKDSPNINLGNSTKFDFDNAQSSAHSIVANRSAQFRKYQNEGSHLRNLDDPIGTTYIKGKLIDIHGENKKSKN